MTDFGALADRQLSASRPESGLRVRGELAALWGAIWAQDVRRRLMRSPKVNGTVSGTEISLTHENTEISVR